MQFSGNFKGKPPILRKFWAQGPPPPLGSKLHWAPLTKILDPRLLRTYWWMKKAPRTKWCLHYRHKKEQNFVRHALLMVTKHVIYVFVFRKLLQHAKDRDESLGASISFFSDKKGSATENVRDVIFVTKTFCWNQCCWQSSKNFLAWHVQCFSSLCMLLKPFWWTIPPTLSKV